MFMMPEIAHMVVAALLIIIPIGIIFKRAGFSPAWAALVFVPGFGVLLVFIFLAFSDWPNQIDDEENLQ